MEIKRLSFKITLNDGDNEDKYISDEIEDMLDTHRIKAKNVLNVTEYFKNEFYTIVIYYRSK